MSLFTKILERIFDHEEEDELAEFLGTLGFMALMLVSYWIASSLGFEKVPAALIAALASIPLFFLAKRLLKRFFEATTMEAPSTLPLEQLSRYQSALEHDKATRCADVSRLKSIQAELERRK